MTKTKELTTEQKSRLDELKERYEVRNFETTSESIKYTQKLAKALSGLKLDMNESQDMDISEIAEFFDPELIKYVVGTFVLVRGAKKSKPVNYEKEFVGDFETVLMVFVIAIEHLSKKANGSKKPQAQVNTLHSKKRP